MLQRKSVFSAVAVSLLSILTGFSFGSEVLAAQLTLTWADSSSNEDGFNIERRVGTAGTYARVGTAGVNVTSYTDSNLLSSTTYCYRVQSYNSAGSSGYSNDGCATTAAATAAITIAANPQSISFAATVGGSAPPPQAITVTVSSGANFSTLDFSPFYDASLACYAGAGNSCASGTQTQLTPNPAFLSTAAPGTYTAPITLSSPGAADLVIPVTLTVAASTVSRVLTVNKSGTGSGTVTGTGINCGTDCSESFASGTSVTLTATAAAGSTFAGWSGTGCSTGTVTVSGNTTCTASFNLVSGFALNVSVVVQATSTGSASGQVVSNPVGINCGVDCSENYSSGTVVTLTPLPGAGSVFAGWTGNSDCTDGSVTMNANKSCTANFALNQALLSVTINGNGAVDSTAGGMKCTSTCTFGVALGSTITLRTTPAAGSSFTGWSGAGCKGTGNCTVALSTNKSVTATFVGSSSNPIDKIGVYRPSTGQWLLDLNGNGVLENCSVDYCVSSFSSPDGVPVSGDWDGSGVSQLGMFLTDTAQWQLDKNANETWDGCGVDLCRGPFGQPMDIPITGKWNAKGYDRAGVFRPSNGRWYLDLGGNAKWNGCDWDRCANLKVYQLGDLPVTGDWDGNGTTQLGLFRPNTGEWFLDVNGNRAWDGCSKDLCLSGFGTSADLPVSGDWNGTGKSKIGVFRPSTGEWFLDFNGNGQWDGCGVDLCITKFGQAGDFPIVGKW